MQSPEKPQKQIEHPSLKPGVEGDHVLLLQQRLVMVGFDPGKIDGKFEDKTEIAVRAFQSAMGLSVDGVVNERFWSLLLSLPTAGDQTPLFYRNPLNSYQPHLLPDYFPNPQDVKGKGGAE